MATNLKTSPKSSTEQSLSIVLPQPINVTINSSTENVMSPLQHRAATSQTNNFGLVSNPANCAGWEEEREQQYPLNDTEPQRWLIPIGEGRLQIGPAHQNKTRTECESVGRPATPDATGR